MEPKYDLHFGGDEGHSNHHYMTKDAYGIRKGEKCLGGGKKSPIFLYLLYSFFPSYQG